MALALSAVCVARGMPLFGICRGLQEMNVAFGVRRSAQGAQAAGMIRGHHLRV